MGERAFSLGHVGVLQVSITQSVESQDYSNAVSETSYAIPLVDTGSASLGDLIELATAPSQVAPDVWMVQQWEVGTCVVFVRKAPNGERTSQPIHIDEEISFPLPSTQGRWGLRACATVDAQSDVLWYVQGHAITGSRCWFKIARNSIEEMASIPALNMVVAVYEQTSYTQPDVWAFATDADAAVRDTDTPRHHGCTTDHDTLHGYTSDQESTDSEAELPDCEALYGEVEEAPWDRSLYGEDDEAHPDVDDDTHRDLAYSKHAMEYVATSSSHCSAGVTVILCTLAELNAGKVLSNWLADFVSCFTSRLPSTIKGTEYVEAYLHAPHFPGIDIANGHIPGCMPLRLYTRKGRQNDFVDLQRYAEPIVGDN